MFKEKSGVEGVSSLDEENQILSLIFESVKEVKTEEEFNSLEGKKDLLCIGDVRNVIEDFEDSKSTLYGADKVIKEAKEALNEGKEIVVVENENGVETYIVGRN